MALFHSTHETQHRKVLSVTELNRQAKSLLEIHLPLIWLEGEVSNLSVPRSGHWYFTLKDDKAQVRAAMFKGRNQQVRLTPKDGDKILVRARVSLYEGRGDFQLIVEHMETSGFGALKQQFEDLKNTLFEEGLFAENRKKALPPFPRRVALITSPSGAAVKDVLSVIKRRYPTLSVVIIPSAVQGSDAPNELIEAITKADQDATYDVIIMCRGGGSIEDLWAFNNEQLARAIAETNTPIISAVGHEIDFTIADFVADIRAPTPSAAGELVSPDQNELIKTISAFHNRLEQGVNQALQIKKQTLTNLTARLRSPKEKLNHWAQQLDHTEIRLEKAIEKTLQNSRLKLNTQQYKLDQCSPEKQIENTRQKLFKLQQKLKSCIQLKLTKKRLQLENSAESLNIVSPLATLNRGYAIVKDQNNRIIHDKNNLTPGDKIQVTVAKGVFKAEVTELGS